MTKYKSQTISKRGGRVGAFDDQPKLAVPSTCFPPLARSEQAKAGSRRPVQPRSSKPRPAESLSGNSLPVLRSRLVRLAPAVSPELGTRTRGFGTELGTGYSLHCTACSIGQLWKSSPLHRMQVSTFLYRIANCPLYDCSSCVSIADDRSTGI